MILSGRSTGLAPVMRAPQTLVLLLHHDRHGLWAQLGILQLLRPNLRAEQVEVCPQ
jgi:hypothetical protein